LNDLGRTGGYEVCKAVLVMVDILFVVRKMFWGSQTERSRAYGKSILPIEGGETAMVAGVGGVGVFFLILGRLRCLAITKECVRF
jgi:hypothetical protein